MSAKIYESVTREVIARMDEGEIPWLRTWNPHAGMPRNIRGTAYRGFNVFWLSMMGGRFESPTWLTKKQTEERGGVIQEDQLDRFANVIYWNWVKKEDENTGKKSTYPLLRSFRVWNVGQCEGVEDTSSPDSVSEPTDMSGTEVAQKLVDDFIQPGNPDGPKFTHGGNQPCYIPPEDAVRVPHPDEFTDASAYFATVFHELGHATGHTSRLKRKSVNRAAKFRSHEYAREELVAEFTASFLCGISGLQRKDTVENAAAYIQSWKKALRDDPRIVIDAAQQAQKAADHIRGIPPFQKEGK